MKYSINTKPVIESVNLVGLSTVQVKLIQKSVHGAIEELNHKAKLSPTGGSQFYSIFNHNQNMNALQEIYDTCKILLEEVESIQGGES